MKFKFALGNGRVGKDEKTDLVNGVANGNGSAHARNHRRVREFMVFAKRFRKMARQKFHAGSENGKHQFDRFQKEFVALTKRFGEAEALQKLQSKIKLSNNQTKLLLGRFGIWFGSSFRNKILLPVVGCTAVVLAFSFFLNKHQFAQQS